MYTFKDFNIYGKIKQERPYLLLAIFESSNLTKGEKDYVLENMSITQEDYFIEHCADVDVIWDIISKRHKKREVALRQMCYDVFNRGYFEKIQLKDFVKKDYVSIDDMETLLEHLSSDEKKKIVYSRINDIQPGIFNASALLILSAIIMFIIYKTL